MDGATDSVIGTAPAGDYPWAMGYNPVANRVYVANWHGCDVSVIDAATMAAIDTVTVGCWPGALALGGWGPDARVFCADQWSNTVTIFDPRQRRVAANVRTGACPWAICSNEEIRRAYTANQYGNSVTVIDGPTASVVATVPVGTKPMAIIWENGEVFCANNGSNTVSVISGSSNNVIATVPVGNGPRALYAPPFLGKIFCANTNSNTVSVIGYESLTVRKTLAVGTRPVAFAEAVGLGVFVVNSGSNNVSVIDPLNDSVIRTYQVGTSPVAAVGYAGAPDQRLVYVANSASDDVTVIDVILDTVIATIPVGDLPQALSVDSFNGKVYCANGLSDNVSVIDCSTNTVIATFPAQWTPVALLYTPFGQTYVASNNGSNVVVIADSPAVAIEESFRPEASIFKPQATVVRGVLWQEAYGTRQTAYRAELLDVAGRKVLALKAGPNDVRHLAPGIYFIRERSAAAIRKVIVAR
jgi:YVTN family beta-propeller protein